MKNTLLIIIFFMSHLVFSQKYTAEQVLDSNNPKLIAGYIKQNPDDPKIPELKTKLYKLAIDNQKSPENSVQRKTSQTNNYKPKETYPKDNYSNRSSGSTNEKTQNTVDILNHLFNGSDPKDKNVFLEISNKSKCQLNISVSGKKNYNLVVPPYNKNYLLIEKGTYKLSTNVCNSVYSEVKSINKDISIALNSK